MYGGDFRGQGSRVSEANGNSLSKKCLSPLAFTGLKDGAEYPPYVSAEDSLPEFTFKAILFGIAGVAFVQNRKADGIGTDWLSEFAGLAAFGFLLACFIRFVRR